MCSFVLETKAHAHNAPPSLPHARMHARAGEWTLESARGAPEAGSRESPRHEVFCHHIWRKKKAQKFFFSFFRGRKEGEGKNLKWNFNLIFDRRDISRSRGVFFFILCFFFSQYFLWSLFTCFRFHTWLIDEMSPRKMRGVFGVFFGFFF